MFPQSSQTHRKMPQLRDDEGAAAWGQGGWLPLPTSPPPSPLWVTCREAGLPETWVLLGCVPTTYRPCDLRQGPNFYKLVRILRVVKKEIQLKPANPKREMYWLITWKKGGDWASGETQSRDSRDVTKDLSPFLSFFLSLSSLLLHVEVTATFGSRAVSLSWTPQS